MFLKSLEIFGFKSFADKTRLDFSDGITSLLGPNGCGKSNIVDAIKWVLGEQSTKTLRAGRMEDVIFNGTDTRKPMTMAEVTLVISNEQHYLTIDDSEIEIKRRIFRSGESEYYLNREKVLLKNIRELFMDTGVGKSAYSILEQGKIDQILSTKPEDRRYIFEEAAGISRYKVQGKEAERKLIKTDENIAQVDTILQEVKRTYELKKNQAERCSRYNALVKEKFSLEVDVQLSSVQTYAMLSDAKTEELKQKKQEWENSNVSLSGIDTVIEEMQENLRNQIASRAGMQTELKRLEEEHRGKQSLLDLLSGRLKDFLLTKDSALQKAEAIKEKLERNDQEISSYQAKVADLVQQKKEVKDEIASMELSLRKAQQLIIDQNKEITDQEQAARDLEDAYGKLAHELEELTDSIVLQLDEKLRQSDYSVDKRVAAREELRQTLDHFVQSVKEQQQRLSRLEGLDASALVSMVSKDLDSNLKNLLRVEKLLASYDAVIPTFVDDFVTSDGIVTRKRTVDSNMKDNRKAVNLARERISFLRDKNSKLGVQCDDYRDNIYDLNLTDKDIEGRIEAQNIAIEKTKRASEELKLDYSDRMHESQDALQRVDETQTSIRECEAEMDQIAAKGVTLSEQLGQKIEDINNLTEAVKMKQNQKNDSYQRLEQLRRDNDRLELQIEQLGEMIKKIYTDFFDNYGKSLNEYEERLKDDLGDTTILKNRLEEVKKDLGKLGYINQMAEDEFNEAKQQYDFLTTQMNDLLKAKGDLQEVLGDITKESTDLFQSTYQQISQNFQLIFKRLFGGGRAELQLSDPDNVLESGIEILAQPPGKKLTALSLLSGGERSMTAVALLFATYQVKPSPFCILDEIDAALDDRNIGFFLSVLDDFSKDSQFIIITHNKHTVIGSTTLLGVTQVEAGVSKTVSYKLGALEGEPVILNDKNESVEFE
ncbi:MAG: AAA family ATPase [Spirochaetia bacterium]|nr:AAA family ATPase [Spirochaetia bacterium]